MRQPRDTPASASDAGVPAPLGGGSGGDARLARLVEEHRPLLFGIAYRMLGSAGDAEDVVQDAFLRLRGTSLEELGAPRSYLVTVTTRLCIDRLRSARAHREHYVGEWLPEPITTDLGDDPLQQVETAESVSLAFLVLLESLTPVERAVFLLREVFDHDYGEIAQIVGKSEQNCRQIAVRARRRVDERRPRFTAGQQGREVVARFLQACRDGDAEAVLRLLAPDVAFHGDGGGKVAAISRAVFGRERAVPLALSFARRPWVARTEARPVELNGAPGVVLVDEGRVVGAVAFDVADGVVHAMWSVVNPDKLGHLHALAGPTSAPTPPGSPPSPAGTDGP